MGNEIKQYRQCRLEREVSPGHTLTTTAWIEIKGAQLGKQVELLPGKVWWKVVGVFEHTLSGDVLKEHQLLHRNSLPSIEEMGRP